MSYNMFGYPNNASLYSVLKMIPVDSGYERFNIDDFYYGWNECHKLGIKYKYPDPKINNNLRRITR